MPYESRQPVTGYQQPETGDQDGLDSVTTNIRQFIFDTVVNPFFICCQSIFRTASPAVQLNRLSGAMYLKRGPAPTTREK